MREGGRRGREEREGGREEEREGGKERGREGGRRGRSKISSNFSVME